MFGAAADRPIHPARRLPGGIFFVCAGRRRLRGGTIFTYNRSMFRYPLSTIARVRCTALVLLTAAAPAVAQNGGAQRPPLTLDSRGGELSGPPAVVYDSQRGVYQEPARPAARAASKSRAASTPNAPLYYGNGAPATPAQPAQTAPDGMPFNPIIVIKPQTNKRITP